MNFPIEVRFVAGDDALLSPAGGRETVYVAVHNSVGMPWEALFRAVAAIGDRHDARPHWGKRHFHTAETLRRATRSGSASRRSAAPSTPTGGSRTPTCGGRSVELVGLLLA